MEENIHSIQRVCAAAAVGIIRLPFPPKRCGASGSGGCRRQPYNWAPHYTPLLPGVVVCDVCPSLRHPLLDLVKTYHLHSLNRFGPISTQYPLVVVDAAVVAGCFKHADNAGDDLVVAIPLPYPNLYYGNEFP